MVQSLVQSIGSIVEFLIDDQLMLFFVSESLFVFEEGMVTNCICSFSGIFLRILTFRDFSRTYIFQGFFTFREFQEFHGEEVFLNEYLFKSFYTY